MAATELTNHNGARDINQFRPAAPAVITEEHMHLLSEMIDRNASKAQRETLALVCQRYGLDPFMGHMVLIQGKCFVTHKGLMHKAHASAQFDGMDTIYGKDELGEFCECTIYRKDMTRPFRGRIYINEYKGTGNVWAKYPRAMAAKTAESFVLRRAFDVALTSQEEMGVTSEMPDEPAPIAQGARHDPSPQPSASEKKAALSALSQQVKRVWGEHTRLAKNWLVAAHRVEDIRNCSIEQIQDICSEIAQMPPQFDPPSPHIDERGAQVDESGSDADRQALMELVLAQMDRAIGSNAAKRENLAGDLLELNGPAKIETLSAAQVQRVFDALLEMPDADPFEEIGQTAMTEIADKAESRTAMERGV